VNRRAFIALIGGAAGAPPLAARAQQAMPIIAFFSSGSWDADTIRLTGFRRGLNETGYVEGQNVAIEYRGMEGQRGQLPAILADVIRRQVAVIVAAGSAPAALAAKAATTTIPIVFATSVDPVAAGLVASFNRPGGNATGLTVISEDLVPKRLQLLHELVPGASTVAVLVNPNNPSVTEPEIREAQNSARSLGLQIHFLNASNEEELDTVFAGLAQLQAGALLHYRRSILYEPPRETH
jgi:putative ABC transport system substrate-binding protein